MKIINYGDKNILLVQFHDDKCSINEYICMDCARSTGLLQSSRMGWPGAGDEDGVQS